MTVPEETRADINLLLQKFRWAQDRIAHVAHEMGMDRSRQPLAESTEDDAIKFLAGVSICSRILDAVVSIDCAIGTVEDFISRWPDYEGCESLAMIPVLQLTACQWIKPTSSEH